MKKKGNPNPSPPPPSHIHTQCGLVYKRVNLAVHFEVFQTLPKNLSFQKEFISSFGGVILLEAMFS